MGINQNTVPFQMVIGLEVHVALNTKSKLFCPCPTAFKAPPNSQCCPVCLGMPGSLPTLNQKALELAIKAGLATHCTIHSQSAMVRKHYFYPDCPKGYQITQGDQPLAEEGYITLFPGSEKEKNIPIARIHIEEDAGKSIHDEKHHETLLDFNRSGIPLIEVVCAPVIHSPQEAVAYLKTLRSTLIYAGVTQGRMNEGDFRCDVNLSIRPVGADKLGQRREIKNLNSFQSVQEAILAEFQNQVALITQNKGILPQTLGFNQKTKNLYPLRSKEAAGDYRYIPEGDLPPITLPPTAVQKIKEALPLSFQAYWALLLNRYGLTPYQAEQLLAEKALADYFIAAAQDTSAYQTLANLMMTHVLALQPNVDALMAIAPNHLAKLAQLLAEEAITSSTGKKLIVLMAKEPIDPENYVQEYNLLQINDEAFLRSIVLQVLDENPQMVAHYHKGKTNVVKSLMGKAMALTQGKGNPQKLKTLFVTNLTQY